MNKYNPIPDWVNNNPKGKYAYNPQPRSGEHVQEENSENPVWAVICGGLLLLDLFLALCVASTME